LNQFSSIKSDGQFRQLYLTKKQGILSEGVNLVVAGRCSGQFQYPISAETTLASSGSCHKRQKPQAPTPQAPIRNRQTKKVANAKGLNRNTNLT